MRNVVVALATILLPQAPALADALPVVYTSDIPLQVGPPFHDENYYVHPVPDPNYYVHPVPDPDGNVVAYEAIVKGSSGYAMVVVPAGAGIEEVGALDLEKALEVWKKRGHFYGVIWSTKGALAVEDLDPDGALEPKEPEVVETVKIPSDALKDLELEGLEVEILRVPTNTGYAYIRYNHGPLTALITRDETAVLPLTVRTLIFYDVNSGDYLAVPVDNGLNSGLSVEFGGGEISVGKLYEPVGLALAKGLELRAEGVRDTVLVIAKTSYGTEVCVGRAEKVMSSEGTGDQLPVVPPFPPFRRLRPGGSR